MTRFNRDLFTNLMATLNKEAFVPPPQQPQGQPPQPGMTAGGAMDPNQVSAYQQGMTPGYMEAMGIQQPGEVAMGVSQGNSEQQGVMGQEGAVQQGGTEESAPAKVKRNKSVVQDRLVGDLFNRITENASRLDHLEETIKMLTSPAPQEGQQPMSQAVQGTTKAGSRNNGTLLMALRNLMVDQQ